MQQLFQTQPYGNDPTDYHFRAKIITINVSYLVNIQRRHDMNVFLKQHKPHIALIAETNLTSSHKLASKNYEFIRNDKILNVPGRGTGILIRQSIKYTIITHWKQQLFSSNPTQKYISAQQHTDQ